MRANQDLRMALKKKGRRQWQLADALEIREEKLARVLRYELPEEEKKKMLNAIEGLK